MRAHLAGVLPAVLEAGAQHVRQDDGLLAGGDGVLMVVGVTGLGVDEGQLQLLKSEGRKERWGGSGKQSSEGMRGLLAPAGSPTRGWTDDRKPFLCAGTCICAQDAPVDMPVFTTQTPGRHGLFLPEAGRAQNCGGPLSLPPSARAGAWGGHTGGAWAGAETWCPGLALAEECSQATSTNGPPSPGFPRVRSNMG